MVVDVLYKISAFGKFLDIEPSPEIMVDMINKFKDYGMIPSIVQEMLYEVDYIDNTQKSQELQRLSLVSIDNKERLLIGSNRIDFEISASDNEKLNNENLIANNEKIIYSFKTILEYFNRKANRLAFNTNTVIANIERKQFKGIFDKFSNSIDIYHDESLKRWAAYFVAVKDILIGETESINIITEINEAKKIKNNELNIDSKGFYINIDINTAPEKDALRFQPSAVRKFIEDSNKIKTGIIENIKKAGDLI